MALLVENVDYKLDHLSDNLYQFYFKQDGIFTPTGLKLKLVEGKDKYKNIFFRSALLDGRYHFQKEITLEPISTDTTIDINTDSYIDIRTKNNILLVKDEFKIGKANDVYVRFSDKTKSYDNGYDDIMVEKLSIDNSKDLTL